MERFTIPVSDLRLVLFSRRVARYASHAQGRFCAVTARPAIDVECSHDLRARERLRDAALRIGLRARDRREAIAAQWPARTRGVMGTQHLPAQAGRFAWAGAQSANHFPGHYRVNRLCQSTRRRGWAEGVALCSHAWLLQLHRRVDLSAALRLRGQPASVQISSSLLKRLARLHPVLRGATCRDETHSEHR